MAPLDPYLPPDSRDTLLKALSLRAKGEVMSFGETVEDRPLLVARLPGASENLPKVLCAAGIHGLEVVGSYVALAFLEALSDGRLEALRARAEVWVAPCLNPDGYARTFERNGHGRFGALRVNARGVDLNRNFPLPGGARHSRLPSTGSSRRGDPTYRGPLPFSEPETRAFDALLSRAGFHALVSLHSTMGTFIPARVKDRTSFGVYRSLWRAFAGAQRVRYLPLHSRTLDVFTGELEDHAHHQHHVWATCVEVYPLWVDLVGRIAAQSAFWRMNPRRPSAWAANDVPAIAAYFLSALDRPRPVRENR